MIHLSYKLTAYIPTQKWDDVAFLLPNEHTCWDGTGSWDGQCEDVTIVTVLSADRQALYTLGERLSRALIYAGEQAALVEYSRADAWLMTKEEVAPGEIDGGVENRATA